MLQPYGLSEDGRTITLEKFEGTVKCAEKPDPNVESKELLIVDVETTGTDYQRDSIIEFAAARFAYQDRRLVRHIETVTWFDDPGVPIPQVITEITGITDDMVRGHSIPERAQELIRSADMLVSHNADFDYRFCQRRWPDAVRGKVWTCSLADIDWQGWGFLSAKQELLAMFHGFFYDAHRADIDVAALGNLLVRRPAPDRPSYFAQICEHIATPHYRVMTFDTDIASKDELKERRYRWDPALKSWWTTCREDNLETEKAWLEELFQRYPRRRSYLRTQFIDPVERWH